MAATSTASLNTCTVQQPRATVNKLHILLHFTAVTAILYYRFSHRHNTPIFPWLLITVADSLFSFVWFLTQAFRWRPVVRTVSPEILTGENNNRRGFFPGVDVFICTADPEKEPTVEVMNTVISAMAIDYPVEKLAVYLSDDGGAASTLFAVREACEFAKVWVPFCRKYGIKAICPEAYFSAFGDDDRVLRRDGFQADEENIKVSYQRFKENVEKASRDSILNDHPARIEVIHDNGAGGENEDNRTNMPSLVYVSREKRPSRPHGFKAGALNALLRVSGIMSNAPYLLVLDCDMYCHDPSSAKQAMCFHLDPKISNSIAFVQYPQMFYNISKKDIYDSQGRAAYKTKYQGMDGIGGTACGGTGYYMKKKALYCCPNQEGEVLIDAERKFGLSGEFIASLKYIITEDKCNRGNKVLSEAVIKQAIALASCSYEENTRWGKEIGYSYDSLLESTFTGYLIHCNGWKSVYFYPKRPCFLGCSTVDMKDAMIQLRKWSSGLLQIALSRFSPLVYGLSRMSVLQSMCYGYFTFLPLFAVALMLYSVVPPLCLISGISLFPKVLDPWFIVFAAVYISSLSQHLYEVLSTGGSIETWWNEQRIFVIKGVTTMLFGCLDVLAKHLGIMKMTFRLTNKAIDREKLEKYEKGVFEFEGAKNFMVPLLLFAILNIICLIGGVIRVIAERNIDDMFVQVFLSSIGLLFSYPVLVGLVLSKRN